MDKTVINPNKVGWCVCMISEICLQELICPPPLLDVHRHKQKVFRLAVALFLRE